MPADLRREYRIAREDQDALALASHRALSVAGLKLDNLNLIELNEAFASQVLAWWPAG